MTVGKYRHFFSSILRFGISGVKIRISTSFDELTLYVCMDSPFVLKIMKLSLEFCQHRLTI